MPYQFQFGIHELTVLIMGIATILCFGIGFLFFFKQSGHKWANRSFGGLLLLGGATQLHYLFDFSGLFADYPNWRFRPYYYTLWLPVLLFFYIKLTLYPRYKPRVTDLKHLALPIGQGLYFLLMWLVPEIRHEDGRWFYSPFYGGFEQALFLFGVPAYLVFSFQYFRRSVSPSRSGKLSATSRIFSGQTLNRTQWYVRQLMRGTLVFWSIYAIVALLDFFAFKFFGKDLRDAELYAAAGALSFSGLLYWWCTYGFQVLIWGRNLRVGWQRKLRRHQARRVSRSGSS
ncbi:MAG: hypothetical protein AAFP08_06760 [Bacteroidota bacterium]